MSPFDCANVGLKTGGNSVHFFAGFFFVAIRFYELWVENTGKCCLFFPQYF